MSNSSFKRSAVVNLRTIFSELYTDAESARRVAHDAGLNINRINFIGSNVNIWQSIIEEAQRGYRIDALLTIALSEYPDNPKLQKFYQPYTYVTNKEVKEQRGFNMTVAVVIGSIVLAFLVIIGASTNLILIDRLRSIGIWLIPTPEPKLSFAPEFLLQHLSDKIGKQIIEIVSSQEDPRLDNTDGEAPLHVQIKFQHSYRYHIIERITDNHVAVQQVRDTIRELYKLPPTDSEDVVQTASCSMGIIIPAGQKARVTIGWTERWAKGVILEGQQTEGNQLGTYEIFLGYIEPCNLLNTEYSDNLTTKSDTNSRTEVGCISIAQCITLDNDLPYTQLPEITIATEVKLVASPLHPLAYLPADNIAGGEKVQLIGTEQNAAWLLVLHDNTLGWMPSIFSRDNISKLKPALVLKPLSDECSTYLGATSVSDEIWISNSSHAVLVLGSIYRSQAEKKFEGTSLKINIQGKGKATKADYMHVVLTKLSAVILFSFFIDDLQKDDQIKFEFIGSIGQPISFQATFFRNQCLDEQLASRSEFSDQLPIGIPRDIATK